MSEQEIRGIEALPDELLVQIISYLDTEPSSVSRLSLEPTLKLTTRKHGLDLKGSSLVSRRWRQIALPLLFKNARLRFDDAAGSSWKTCTVCGPDGVATPSYNPLKLSPVLDEYHLDMIQDVLGRAERSATFGQAHDAATSGNSPTTTVEYVPVLYHALREFLDFLEHNDLCTRVETFVLLVSKTLECTLDRFPHHRADNDWRYIASAAFWYHLLGVIDPRTVVIVASPTDLAFLANCAIDTFGEWAFSDMNYHLLELTQDDDNRSSLNLCPKLCYSDLEPAPQEYPGIAKSSVLRLRPWTTVGLNEGSFLKAYGTYEFFERGPPSLVYSIKDCFLIPPPPTMSELLNGEPAQVTNTRTCLHAMRAFKYTGIFPFATHLQLNAFLYCIEELEIRLAPVPEEHAILADKDRVGKADLADCWSELDQIYRSMAINLMTYRRPVAQPYGHHGDAEFVWETRQPNVMLKRLVCHDFAVAGLRREMDDLFTHLCLPVWAEYESGIFTRLLM